MKKIKINEKEFKKLYPRKSNAELATKYGCAESTIRFWASSMGVRKAENGAWSEDDERWLLRNYDRMSAEELMKHLGRSYWGVMNKYRQLRKGGQSCAI